MSHWVRQKISITDKQTLMSALKEMGLNPVEKMFKVGSHTAHIKIDKSNRVGMKMEDDGTWSLIGDPYYCQRGSKMKSYYGRTNVFATDLMTLYNKEDAKNRLEEMGYELEEMTEENDEIVMTYSSY